MEERIAKFVAALRASGVRVSVSESLDAWRAVSYLGSKDRTGFRLSLRSTLVKDAVSLPVFETLFSQYFGNATPPLIDPQAGLPEDVRQMIQRFVNQQVQHSRQVLEWLLSGQGPSQEDFERLAEQSGLNQADTSMPYLARSAARRMRQVLSWNELQKILEQLWDALAEYGLNPGAIEELKQQVFENQARLDEQLEAFAGARLNDRLVEQTQHRDPVDDLLHRPFSTLSAHELDELRAQVHRLAARLRTRAALRQKRDKQGTLDPKATIRANLRYGGVPFEVRFKHRRLKPKLVVLLDVSTSMRSLAEFFLRMLHELQDHIQKTRNFAFIDHIEEVTTILDSPRIDESIQAVLTMLPSGYYNTDLGHSLRQFEHAFLGTVDSRTTVIILGDGRNNYNDPGLAAFSRVGQRARRLIWMNPEFPDQWGTGDSDMLDYEPLCSAVYQVRNLAQLADAIDRILV